MNKVQQFIDQNNLKSVSDFNAYFLKNNIHLEAVQDDGYSILTYKDNNYTEFSRLFNYCFVNKDGKIVHYFEPKHYDNLKKNGIDTGDENCFDFSKKSVQYDVILYNEGSLIKIFFDDNKWHFATSRKADASRVFWTSNEKSFKHLFFEAFNGEYSFDKDYCYTFLLQHPENFITLPVTKNAILVNKIEMKTYTVYRDCIEDFKFCNKSIEDIFSNKDRNVCDNYMIYGSTLDGEEDFRIKIVSDAYIQRQEMIKNSQSPINVCLRAIKEDNTEKLITVLPDFTDILSGVENDIEEACKTILAAYTLRYMAKHKINIHKKYDNIINIVHKKYMDTRTPIKYDDIKECLIKLNINELKVIIRG